jgi:hypothetical protein
MRKVFWAVCMLLWEGWRLPLQKNYGYCCIMKSNCFSRIEWRSQLQYMHYILQRSQSVQLRYQISIQQQVCSCLTWRCEEHSVSAILNRATQFDLNQRRDMLFTGCHPCLQVVHKNYHCGNTTCKIVNVVIWEAAIAYDRLTLPAISRPFNLIHILQHPPQWCLLISVIAEKWRRSE